MDFLNKAYAQIADLFRSMTPGARITAGLLLVVVVVSLGYLFNSQISSPNCDLLHGARVSDSQLDLMMSAFGKANLSEAVRKNGTIYVPQGQEAKYMGALADNKALPQKFGGEFGKVIDNSNLLMGSEERNSRWIVAKQEEIKNAISHMSGISDASVMIDSTITPGFKREKLVTASVFVQPNGMQEIDDEIASKIRLYVAASVAGMKKENVTVTDQNGRSFSSDPANGGGSDNEYLMLQRSYEKELQAKIRKSLASIPGVTVSTSVKLDTTKKTRTTELKHDKANTVEVHSMQSDTERTSETAGTGGQAGFAAQQPNTRMALGNNPVGGSKEEDKGSKSESTNFPSSKQTDVEKIGMTPIMERATIGIPSGYFKKAWLLENPPAAGQEPKDPDVAVLDQFKTKTIDKIKKQVTMLLTPPEGSTDPQQLLQLVDVSDFPEIPAAFPPEPSMAKNAMTWIGDYWSVAGMIGLAGVSLMMLRSLVKSAPPLEQDAMPRLADTPEEDTKSSGEKKPKSNSARRFSTGPSLRDEISDLVKEDPEIAASVLKTWIANAG